MKTRNQWVGIKFVAAFMALCAFAISAQSAVLIDEMFDTGYQRTVQDIAGGNMAWLKGRSGTVATVNVGSLSFSASANGGADGEWGYFNDPSANFVIGGSTGSYVQNGRVNLAVGDRIQTSVSLYMDNMATLTGDGGLRIGLFDSPNGQSINDFNGGATSTMFTNSPGFATFYSMMSASTNNGMSILNHTVLTSFNIFSSSGNYQAIGAAGGGAMTGMSSLNNYTLNFSVERPDASNWLISSEVRDTLTGNLIEGMNVITNGGVSTFGLLLLRWARMPDVANGGGLNYTEIKVSVDAIPEPSTLMLAGTGLALAALAIRRRR